jgi:hypothetical protein
LVLERYNMADRIPYGDAVDARVRAEMRRLWPILYPASRTLDGGRRVAYGVPIAGQARATIDVGLMGPSAVAGT